MAKAKTTKSEVAVVPEEKGEVPSAQVFDFGEDAGAGYENQSSDDMSIPFIGLRQSNSPLVTAEDSEYKAGMLFNTVTHEAIPGRVGFEFIAVTTQHKYVEWVPRDNGGGWVGVYDLDSPIVQQAKAKSKDLRKLKTESGNDLLETFYVYGVLLEDEIPVGMAIIPFTSTKIKVYRGWNTKLNGFAHRKHGIPNKPPLYANRVRVTTFKDKNAKGEFYNYVLSPSVPAGVDAQGIERPDVYMSLIGPKDPRYIMAKECKELIESGVAKAAYETQDSAGPDTGGETGDVNSEKAPF